MALDLSNRGSVTAWADAFTLQQEAMAEAKNNPQLRASVADAIKHARSAVKDAATDDERKEAAELLANQMKIQEAMKFDIDAFRGSMMIWRALRAELRDLGWNLLLPIEVEPIPGGKFKAWQAGSDLHAEWDQHQFDIVAMFLKFVSDIEAKAPDPIEYTKQMLADQGITADNFHLHADKLAIQNPWKPAGIITEGLDAFMPKG